MAKYQLLDIALKQAFANNGLTQRVPYQLSSKDDDLNWLEGFTDAFQRPVLPQADAGNANGRYIKMGQLNQILQNLSQAILNVKQGLDNVQGTIDDDVSIKIENIIKESEEVLNNRVVDYLQTINNQNCAGLKNFTGVNINNFKTSPRAVANLEWCNGVPIQTNNYYNKSIGTSLTITGKSGVINCKVPYPQFIGCISLHLNNKSVGLLDGFSGIYNRVFLTHIPVRKGDIYNIVDVSNCRWEQTIVLFPVYLGS